MAFSRLLLALFLATISSTILSADSAEKALEPVQLVAPDGSVRANFIRYGATVTDFWVKDKKGVFRDILLGFDNHTFYQNDAEGHPYFGPIVGRYANRIRNGTFTIPISKDASGPNKFFVPRNGGNNTLHGGFNGFDNCWLFDEVQHQKPAFSMWNTNSGIKLDIFTNQPALQIYTCNGFNATLPIPRKKSQGGPSGIYTDHSCIVIENESVIDAINNPEFGVNQIYGPGRPYNWEASYVFSTL